MKEKHVAFILASIGLIIGLALSLIFNKIVPRNFKVSEKNQSIISLAPNITQTLIFLNSHDKIAARSGFCGVFKQVKHLPSAGNNFNVKYEKILSLQPTLIITQGKNPALKKFSIQHKIKYLNVNMDNVDTIFSGILKIGKAVCKEKLAKRKVSMLKNKLNEISKLERNGKRKKVLIILNRREHSLSGIFTTGNKSFLSQAIRIAGGINVFNDMKINYSSVSIETILKRNPDVIIELSVKSNLTKKRTADMKKQWSSYSFINAVKNKQIYFLKQSYILIPGPGIIKTIRLFNKIFTGKYKAND